VVVRRTASPLVAQPYFLDAGTLPRKDDEPAFRFTESDYRVLGVNNGVSVHGLVLAGRERHHNGSRTVGPFNELNTPPVVRLGPSEKEHGLMRADKGGVRLRFNRFTQDDGESVASVAEEIERGDAGTLAGVLLLK